MKKRLLSMLLVLVMILGMIPMAMAEEAAEPAVTVNFNTEFAKGKVPAKYTEADDGWAWYEAGCVNAKPQFYAAAAWTEKALRVVPADAAVTDLTAAISVKIPTAGKYKVDVTYAPGAVANYTTVKVGGAEMVYFGYGAWTDANKVVSTSDAVLVEGNNLITFSRTGTAGEFLIREIAFTLIEEVESTKVALDFNADAATGKTPTQFTLGNDGWAYDAANSSGVAAPVFYQWPGKDAVPAWDYKVLRFTQNAAGGTGAIAFNAPVGGTYRMDLTYAVGNSGNATELKVGGTTTSFHQWAQWGAAPKSISTYGVKLNKGSNLLTVCAPTGTASYLMLKDITFTLVEQENVFGLNFAAFAEAGKKADTATLEANGWAINTEKTAATVDFYKFGGNDNYPAWDYRVLRAQGKDTDMAVDFTVPATGTYKMELVYAFGNNCGAVDVAVGDVAASFNGYAAWGSKAPATLTVDEILLTEGTNTITITPVGGGMALIKAIKFVPVDTVIKIDFDKEFGKQKHEGDADVSPYTIEEDGWCYDAEKSYNMTPSWYRYVDTNHEDANGDSTWGYRVLRLVQSAEGSLGVINFPVVIPGTYTLTLEYAVGNNGNATEVYVGGTTTAFHSWAAYGTPYKTAVTEGVELAKGINAIEFAVKGASGHIFVKKVTLTLIEAGEVTVEPEEPVCEHTETTVEYLDNGDGTHTADTTCADCFAIISTEIENCYDFEDGTCICGATVEVACDHANTSETTTANADKTHTVTVTCECGEVISTETVACADGDDDDTLCDVCGNDLYEAPEIEKVAFAGSNMTLGNELEVNFLMTKKNLASGIDYTAYITQHMADGTERVTELAMADWNTMGSYHKISARIAAREMADELSIEIKDADGNVYNESYSTSVRGYAGRALAAPTTTDYVRIMMIDMLNYGAAAQNHFKYNTADLANNELTEAQQALATAKVTCTNNQVKDATVYGANLSLEDSILLNTFFKGLKNKDIASMYAMVNFTDFEGKAKEVRMEGTEFEKYGSSGDIYKIVVDDVVLADAKTLVTVTVYNADGTVFGAGSDSVESYVARAESNNADTYGLYANIMKFATSAYNYIINK